MNINPKHVDIEPPLWTPGEPGGGYVDTEYDQTFGSAFPDSLLIPRSDWRDRIEELEKYNLSLLH